MMSDALAVIAIYLTLATLLMTTCFGRIESWHSGFHRPTMSGLVCGDATSPKTMPACIGEQSAR